MRPVARLLVALLLLPALAEGQQMTLTVTGANAAATSPTLAEYVAGSMARSFTYTLSLAGASQNATYPTGCSYTGTVTMTARDANLGNSKALSDISWSSTGSGAGAASTLVQNQAVTLGTQTFTSFTTAASVTVTLTTTLRWTETSTSFAGTALLFGLTATPSGGNNC